MNQTKSMWKGNFSKERDSGIWRRVCKIKTLSGNEIGNGHSRQIEQKKSRHGSGVAHEKFRKHQSMHWNYSSV